MTLTFYPHADDAQRGSLMDRVAILMEAAERYKSVVLEIKPEAALVATPVSTRGSAPRDMTVAYNWEEIAQVLRQIRELPESSAPDKAKKGDLLAKLAEVYEVLRAAKMAKLEAVRLALMGEANHLREGGTKLA